MAYKDILPQTNLDAVDIRDTIGCPSNNLADYCVKAKTGGIGGYAFKIAENGHLPSDGYLIEGASPYFNIWSSNSPGEWAPSNAADKYPRFRLRRNTYGNITINDKLFDSNSYCFDLGTYRGYKHTTKAPTVGEIVRLTDQDDEYLRAYIRGFNLGEYDWKSLINNKFGYAGKDTSNLYISFVGSSTFENFGVKFDDIQPNQDITGDVSNPITETFSMVVEDRRLGGRQTICYIPLEKTSKGNTGGKYEHTIYPKTEITPILKTPSVRYIVFANPDVRLTTNNKNYGYLPGPKRTLAYIGFTPLDNFNLDKYLNAKCSFFYNGIRYTNIPVQLRPGDWIHGFDSGGPYMVIFEHYGLDISYDSNITLLITPF